MAMNKGFSLVHQLPDGTWSDPEPMQIDDYNISSAAISLTMSNDASVLIMSLPKSQGSQDNDLFISFKIGEKHWSAPTKHGVAS